MGNKKLMAVKYVAEKETFKLSFLDRIGNEQPEKVRLELSAGHEITKRFFDISLAFGEWFKPQNEYSLVGYEIKPVNKGKNEVISFSYSTSENGLGLGIKTERVVFTKPNKEGCLAKLQEDGDVRWANLAAFADLYQAVKDFEDYCLDLYELK
jgi:hypothetical protein